MNRSEENRLLLHILKNNPVDGEVYFTFNGETFVGHMQNITVETSVDSLTSFEISGVIRNKK